jgi:4-hydroxyphenylacetate 3-monooxygenase
MEASGSQQGEWFVPNKHMMYAAQVLTQELYPQIVSTIRDLAGGGMIMLPSSAADYGNPEIARIIRTTQQSPVATPDERVKFMKLAWDAVGSEFASRHLQYEMFYAGAQFVTRGHSWRTYDWNRALAMVDGLLDSYAMPENTPAGRAA